MTTALEIEKACGLDLESLDHIPLDVVLAKPEFNGDHLVDVEVVWANKKLRDRGLFEPIGFRFTQIYPQLASHAFFEILQNQMGKPTAEIRPYKRTVLGPSSIPYELTLFWAGSLLYAHVNEIDPDFTIEEGLPFALQLLFGSISKLPIAVSYVSEKSSARFATEAFLKGFSIPHEVFENSDLPSLVHPDDQEKFQKWFADPLKSSVSIRVSHQNQTGRWVEVSASDITDLVGNKHGRLIALIDISHQVQLREAIEQSRELKAQSLSLLTAALDVSRDGFAVWSAHDQGGHTIFRLDFINEAGAKPTGLQPQKLIGKPIDQVLPDDHENLSKLFAEALATKKRKSAVVEVNSESGWVGAYENNVVPLSDHQVVTNFRDISDERFETRRLEWLVTHDHLTGLINRRGLETALQEHLDRLNRDSKTFGFAFVDLDGFKCLNDKYGHQTGDDILTELAAILSEQVAQLSGVAARISGDEFALIFDDVVGESCIASFLEKLRPQVAAHFERSIGEPLYFSSGTVLVQSKTANISEILRVADKAMYQAKHLGKNTSRHVLL